MYNKLTIRAKISKIVYRCGGGYSMFSKLERNEAIESAARMADLNVVKSLVAISKNPPVISAETLAELLNTPEQMPEWKLRWDIAIFLMNNCDWCEFELELKLSKNVHYSLINWFKQKNSPNQVGLVKELLLIPQIIRALQVRLIESDLRQSIKNKDFDGFVKKFAMYCSDENAVKQAVASLNESFLNLTHDVLVNDQWLSLTEFQFLKVREYFKSTDQEWGPFYLGELIRDVDVKDAVVLAKFIELGVANDLFIIHVGMGIEPWCVANNCTDLLALESVRKNCTISKLTRIIKENQATPERLRSYETDIITCIDTYYEDDSPEEFKTLWQTAAAGNLVELLKYPNFIPTEGVTMIIHDLIIASAIKGYGEVVSILIEHARQHMPNALRFHESEISKITNQNLVEQIKQAASPATKQTGLTRLVTAGINFFLPEEHDTKDREKDQDLLFKLDM